MSDETKPDDLEFSFDYAEPREKLWRAISNEAVRERWLPDQNVLEVLEEQPLEQLSLLMEEAAPPHLRSVVSFTLTDTTTGGTVLTINHRPSRSLVPANSNALVMRAA